MFLVVTSDSGVGCLREFAMVCSVSLMLELLALWYLFVSRFNISVMLSSGQEYSVLNVSIIFTPKLLFMKFTFYAKTILHDLQLTFSV